MRSQPGVGSTFTFTLPVAQQVGVEAEAAAPGEPPAETALTAEEAFRRLGITFEEEKAPENPPPASPPGAREERGRKGLFGRWKK